MIQQDYSSYRVPYIDEFIPGFKFEYVSFISSKILDIPSNPLCQHIMGTKGRVLKVYKDTNEADVEFYGLYPNNISFITKINLDSLFSKDSLYKKWIYEPCKSSTYIWKEGIWGSAFGIFKEEELIKALKKGYIRTKSKITIHPANKHNIYPWITVYNPDYPTNDKYYSYTVTLKSLKKRNMKNYSISYVKHNNTYENILFTSESELYDYLEKNKHDIKIINDMYNCTDLTNYFDKKLVRTSEDLMKHFKNLEALPMKRENNKKGLRLTSRSIDRMKRKKIQKYDNYKRNKVKGKHKKEYVTTSIRLENPIELITINGWQKGRDLSLIANDIRNTYPDRKFIIQYTKPYIYSLNKYIIILQNNEKKIVMSTSSNYKKMLKREHIELSPIIKYIYIEKEYNWGTKTNLVYSNHKIKKIQYKTDKSKKKDYYSCSAKKGEKRLIPIQLIEDPTRVEKVEKWLAEEIVKHNEWKIINKEEYRNHTSKYIYLKNKFTKRIIAIQAKNLHTLKRYEWEESTFEDYNTYINSLKIDSQKLYKGKKIHKSYKNMLKSKSQRYSEKRREDQKRRKKKASKSPIIRLNKSYQKKT